MNQPFREVGYAVEVLAALSRRDTVYATATLLARRTGLMRSDLVRILRRLVDAAILDARRGVHGGYRLTRPLSSLNLLEVTDAILGRQWLPTCPLGRVGCPGTRACTFHESWNRQRDALRLALRSIGVANAVRGSKRSGPGTTAGMPADEAAAWLHADDRGAEEGRGTSGATTEAAEAAADET